MSRTTVGILRGGTSHEYELSLKTGAVMLAALPEDRYDVRDIFIDRRGFWHSRGIPSDPARALSQVDVVLSALHGGVGEDGSVQRILDRAGVAYAGSPAHSSALAYNKARAREALTASGVRIPRGMSFSLAQQLTTGEMARAVFSAFGPPYVLKPATEGASHGVAIADSIVVLPDMLADLLDTFGAVVVEEYVRGREAAVAVIEGFRGEDLYTLPPARVRLPEGARMLGHGERAAFSHQVPGDFSHAEKQDLAAIARAAHRALGLSHFSRADIMVTARGVPYLLEVNATPKLHEGAMLPPALESVGSSVREFLEHQIRLARA